MVLQFYLSAQEEIEGCDIEQEDEDKEVDEDKLASDWYKEVDEGMLEWTYEDLDTFYRSKNNRMNRQFYSYIMCNVSNKRSFLKQSITKKISEFFTVTDEAFARLVLENNWERWLDMIQNNKSKVSEVKAKYTTMKEKNLSARWSNEGIDRFNALCHAIVEERRTEGFKRFEEYYLKHCQEKYKKMKGGSGKNIVEKPRAKRSQPFSENGLGDECNKRHKTNASVRSDSSATTSV